MSDLAAPLQSPQPPPDQPQPDQTQPDQTQPDQTQPDQVQRPSPWGGWASGRDLRVAGTVVAALVVAGALAGWPWQHWSPRTVALVYSPGSLVPDEKEAYIAGDARFVVITGVLGVLAALIVWSRRGWRSPAMPVALAIGGIAGALATGLIGRWTGGGHGKGTVGDIVVPPVGVHATAFLFAEAALALLAYAVCVLFSTADDLGRG